MTVALAPTPTTTRRSTKRIVKPFTLPHFRAWAADLILDTGKSWHPESFQEAFAAELFAGIPECWLIVPEGNGKTTLLAGIALYHAEHRPFAVVPVAAASREQAEIMYRQAEGFVLRSERLHQAVHSNIQVALGKRKTDVPRFVCLQGYRRVNHHGGGRIQIFAADDRTGDGVIPTLGIIDEPHRQRDLSLYRTWSGKLMKRDGQIATISTAGEPGSDFEETRARIRESATELKREGSFLRAASGRIVLHEWALPEGEEPEDLDAVKRTNPFSGITRELLEAKLNSPTMTMHHWLRFVCNRPTRDVTSWLGDDGDKLWAGLADPWQPPTGSVAYVGVDIAIKRDTSAVVVLVPRGEGEEKRYHAQCRIWVPTDTRPVDVTDVMQHLRELAETLNVRAISFDPRFFDVPAKMLADEGLPLVEVPQSVEHMTVAVGGLYEAIHSEKISHDDDVLFTNQVLNAVPRYNDRAFTLEKSKSHGKIDAAIALALAYDQALRHEEEDPSIYEDRGMVAFG
jgi:phage terminase large subunit-like protein